MKTDDRLRRFEWALARDEQARASGAMLRIRTHELLNLVQIVDLASQVILDRCGAHIADLCADLRRAADDARTSVTALQEIAQPPPREAASTRVGETARRIASAAVRVDDQLSIAWSSEELEMLLAALAADAPSELLVRDRAVEGHPTIEIVCGPVDAGSLGVRLARAVATRAGGEVTHDAGARELVVAIPAL